jgi:hypothetical protein
MLKTKTAPAGDKLKRFNGNGAPEAHDLSRVRVLLAGGFGVAAGYSSVSRDRHYLELAEGVSEAGLAEFFSRHLKGSPMPGHDPIIDGPVLLSMARAAEEAGLVKLHFVKAGAFVPERGLQ